MAEFEVRGGYITLGQLLKALGLTGTGGEARDFLTSGAVAVNGEPEARRGRKLRPGDVARVGQDEWRMVGPAEAAADDAARGHA